MNFKTGILVFTLIIGCIAIPTPEDDLSMFYYHTDPSARIVGGTQAADASHPHMVAMSSGLLIRSFLCGGSLLSQRTVLTAAHCIDAVFSFGSLSRQNQRNNNTTDYHKLYCLIGDKMGDKIDSLPTETNLPKFFRNTYNEQDVQVQNSLRVTVGSNRWNSGGTNYNLARNVTHPNYVSATIKNDIGLLITSSNVVLTARVQPIGLTYSYIGAGVPSRVAGWGRIAQNGALSATLLEIELDTIGGQECVDAVRQAAIDFNTNAPPVEPHIEVCTFHSAGRGTCNGDSGSALTRRADGLQFGIVSWGFPCARGAPDMFVRIGGFQDFLQSNIV